MPKKTITDEEFIKCLGGTAKNLRRFHEEMKARMVAAEIEALNAPWISPLDPQYVQIKGDAGYFLGKEES